MIGLNASPPPEDKYESVRFLLDLARAVADPKALDERLKKLIAQETTANAATDTAQKETERLRVLKEATLTEINDAQQKHAARIASEAAAHADACKRRSDQLDQREQKVSEAEKRTTAAKAEAEKLLAEQKRRLRALEGA